MAGLFWFVLHTITPAYKRPPVATDVLFRPSHRNTCLQRQSRAVASPLMFGFVLHTVSPVYKRPPVAVASPLMFCFILHTITPVYKKPPVAVAGPLMFVSSITP